MTYAEYFYEIKNKFMGTDVSDIHEHLAFQFDIEDPECGGIFYVEVKDGQLFVEPYEYYDRDAKFIASPDTFTKLAEGTMDPVAAFTMQKLKVEGNIDKALRLKEIIDLKKKQEKEAKKKAVKATKTEAKAAAKTTKTAAKKTTTKKAATEK
ncbi:MAG: SCP2 sterol-binding domain-containing protein [Clostridiales bacterium]|nr:SCP2 sterol-binding domain-containing protein [Clostridiales bacterium]